MAVSPDQVLKDLKDGKFAPMYFLHGEEPYYIDLIADFVEQNALTPAEKGFNQTIVYGKDANVNLILENARRFPMMAQRQVIIVKEAQEVQDLGKKDGQEKLLRYCQNLVPTTVLVFCHKHKKLDGRSELAKSLDKFAVLVESKRIYDNQVAPWVRQYCKDKGYAVSDKAVNMIAEYIGNDLTRVANEIGKMLINLPQGAEITDEHVTQNIGISREYNAFELQTALAKRDVVKANQIVNYFAANPKDNPIIPTISLIFNYFAKVLLLHQYHDRSKDELAKLLKVNPYFLQEYQIAARNYPVHKTMQVVHLLHQADLQSKGVDSSADESQLLKELVFRILH